MDSNSISLASETEFCLYAVLVNSTREYFPLSATFQSSNNPNYISDNTNKPSLQAPIPVCSNPYPAIISYNLTAEIVFHIQNESQWIYWPGAGYNLIFD